MNTHQRRLGRKERKRQEEQAKARDRAARRRDIDADMPLRVNPDAGRLESYEFAIRRVARDG